jgi:hypothetical protein
LPKKNQTDLFAFISHSTSRNRKCGHVNSQSSIPCFASSSCLKKTGARTDTALS